MARRTRISTAKEDRIWNLRCMGYRYESIAMIVNVSASSPGKVIGRVRRRPPLDKDPIKRGRKRGFFTDQQIAEIRQRRAFGHTYATIAKDFYVHESVIGKICRHEYYIEPNEDSSLDGFRYDFSNRLMSPLRR